jgi:hypothetical protein
VRERIERVAATDFTVLVEGASGPQPHPDFIEVFGQAALDDGEGEVEGERISSAGLRTSRRPELRRVEGQSLITGCFSPRAQYSDATKEALVALNDRILISSTVLYS